MRQGLRISRSLIISVISVSMALVVVVVLLNVNRKYSSKTPTRILKSMFDISLKDFDYTVKSFEENWLPNGDGECEIIFEFKGLSPENIRYLETKNVKRLPMPVAIRKHFSVPNNGYFIYDTLPGGLPNYAVFIIDTDNNTALLRCEMF